MAADNLFVWLRVKPAHRIVRCIQCNICESLEKLSNHLLVGYYIIAITIPRLLAKFYSCWRRNEIWIKLRQWCHHSKISYYVLGWMQLITIFLFDGRKITSICFLWVLFCVSVLFFFFFFLTLSFLLILDILNIKYLI